MDETANATAIAHAVRERHIAPSSCGAAATTSGASSFRLRRWRARSVIHGTAAMDAVIAHTPTETRQPKAAAIGAAPNAGKAVLSDITAAYPAVIVPMRSGK